MSRMNWHAILVVVVLGLSLAGSGWGCGARGGTESGASATDDSSGGDDDEVAAPNSAVHKTGSGSVSGVFGSPGGSLELTGGPRVEIPPGAVEGAQEFVLKTAQKTTVFGNRESEKPVGPTFSFSPGIDAPEGRTITVSLPLPSIPDGWGEPSIAYEVDEGAIASGEDSTRTKWQYENASLSGGRAVAQMPGLPGLRLQFVLTNLEVQ